MKTLVSRRSEDYLRVIYEIAEAKGYVRIKDISRALGVKPSTAVEMVRKLHELGLVDYKKYEGITLTARGKEIAEAVKKRRDIFENFLKIILVPENVAKRDAHILEHQLSPETVLQIARFVEFASQAKEWIDEFRNYCEMVKRLDKKSR